MLTLLVFGGGGILFGEDGVQQKLEALYKKNESYNRGKQKLGQQSIDQLAEFNLLQAIAPKQVLIEQIVTKKNDTQYIVKRSWYNLATHESASVTYLLKGSDSLFDDNSISGTLNPKDLVYGIQAKQDSRLFYNEHTKKWGAMSAPDLFAANQLRPSEVFFKDHRRVRAEENRLAGILGQLDNGSDAQLNVANELKNLRDHQGVVELLTSPEALDSNDYHFEVGNGGVMSRVTISSNGLPVEKVWNYYGDNIDFKVADEDLDNLPSPQTANHIRKDLNIVGFRSTKSGSNQIITSVISGTPAAVAGLEPGDVIKEIRATDNRWNQVENRVYDENIKFYITVLSTKGETKIFELQPITRLFFLPNDEAGQKKILANLF
jgi:hypothetical protein